MKTKDLIAKLGGGGAVARQLGVSPAAVSNWSAADAIPPARHVEVWRLATEAGIAWTPPGADGLRLVREPVPAGEPVGEAA